MNILNNNKKTLHKALLAAFISLICLHPYLSSGNYTFEKGTVSIALPAPVGDILAVNKMISGFIEPKTGDMYFSVSVDGFHFITSFMPDHINVETTKRFKEYYLETSQFPNASFKGKITDIEKVNFEKEGTYNVQTKGVITVHGVAQEITRNSTIIVKGQHIILKTSFVLNLNSYKIRVPEVLQNVFFKDANVAVECQLK